MRFSRHSRLTPSGLALVGFGLLISTASCSSRDIIGYVETTETASSMDSATDSLADSESQTDSTPEFPLPFVLDFTTAPTTLENYGDPEWIWNEESGTYDITVTFTESPDNRMIELDAGSLYGDGGVDCTGATAIEYRVKVPTLTGGAWCKGFIQSAVGDPLVDANWRWHETRFDITPGTGWITLTLSLTGIDPANYNPASVTKFGFQVLDPGAARPDPDTDPSAPVPLPEPAEVVIQIDSITVLGTNP